MDNQSKKSSGPPFRRERADRAKAHRSVRAEFKEHSSFPNALLTLFKNVHVSEQHSLGAFRHAFSLASSSMRMPLRKN
jgi:hypothetical protein